MSLNLDEILSLYHKAIVEDDASLLEALNENVELDELTYNEFLDFVANLVTICYEQNNKEACEYILSNRDNGKFTDTNTRIPLITAIFQIYMEDEIYVFIKESLDKEYVYIDHMINLLHADSSEEIVATASLISDLYGIRTYDEYSSLIKYYRDNEDAGNKKVYEFIIEKMKQVNEYAPIPYYMKDSLFENEEKETRKELQLFRYAQKLIPETRYVYIPYLKSVPPPINKYTIDYSIEQDQYSFPDDIRLFRILGPRNPKDDTFYQDQYQDVLIPLIPNSTNPENMIINDTEDLCTSYGGCRMLTCMEFEKGEGRGDYNDEELINDIEFGSLLDLDTSSWFRKACDLCAKQIKKKRYSLRMALLRGGWRGCYCSLVCVLNDIPDNKDKKILIEINTRYYESLKKFGLLDIHSPNK